MARPIPPSPTRLTRGLRAATAWFAPKVPKYGRAAFHARFLVGACLLAGVIGGVSGIVAFGTGQWAPALVIAAFLTVLAGHLVALRVGVSTDWLVWTVLASLATFLVVVSLPTRELDEQQLAWLLLLPLSARVLDGPLADDVDDAPVAHVPAATVGALVCAGIIVACHEIGWTLGEELVRSPLSALHNFTTFLASAFGMIYVQERSSRETVAELKQLRSMLSVCAWCKRISDAGEWVSLEQYTARHTQTDLTHGICPSCEHHLDRAD